MPAAPLRPASKRACRRGAVKEQQQKAFRVKDGKKRRQNGPKGLAPPLCFLAQPFVSCIGKLFVAVFLLQAKRKEKRSVELRAVPLEKKPQGSAGQVCLPRHQSLHSTKECGAFPPSRHTRPANPRCKAALRTLYFLIPPSFYSASSASSFTGSGCSAAALASEVPISVSASAASTSSETLLSSSWLKSSLNSSCSYSSSSDSRRRR